MARFSQAISEGDGISVVPLLEGDVAELAALAEDAGAEAIAVSPRDAGAARAATSLPLVVDGLRDAREIDELVKAGLDGCVFVYDLDAGEGELLDELYPAVDRLGIDCAVEVRETEDLAEILDRLDPEIVVCASAHPNDEDELEHVLDLMVDVPAGKLVVARPRRPIDREQIVALERAGVDAILVDAGFLRVAPDFAAALAELTGR
jgi:indole-3-glycerol phosphate synthase